MGRIEEDERRRRDEEQAKTDRAIARLAKQAPREAAPDVAGRGEGRGMSHCRAPISGQGGGRDRFGCGVG